MQTIGRGGHTSARCDRPESLPRPDLRRFTAAEPCSRQAIAPLEPGVHHAVVPSDVLEEFTTEHLVLRVGVETAADGSRLGCSRPHVGERASLLDTGASSGCCLQPLYCCCHQSYWSVGSQVAACGIV